MEKKKSSRRKKIQDDEKELNEEDPHEEEKRSLRSQISELEDLITEIEFALNQPKFGDIDNTEMLELPVQPMRSYRLKNVDCLLQYELYKLSGLYCAKFTKHEYIFNFSPFSTIKNGSLYTLQFFTENGSGRIGKYIMPSSGILENILQDTPIDKLTGLIPFFRNCKRHLDCYVDRKEQFEKLKELTKNVKNIRVDADYSFVLITCNFLQVYRKSSDNFVDIAVYLSYDYGKARPSTVNVDWSMKKKPSEDDVKGLKSFVKIFRVENLIGAYRHIEESNHNIFSWKATEVGEEILNVNDLSDSEEEGPRPTRSRRVPTKRKRSPSLEENKETEEEAGSQVSEEPERFKQPTKKPVIKKSRPKPKAQPKTLPKAQPKAKPKAQPKTQPKVQTKTQPGQNSPQKVPQPIKKSKIRQSTLNFSKLPPKDSDDSTPHGKNPMKNPRIMKAVSSTPLHRSKKNRQQPNTLVDISPIVAEKTQKKLTKGKEGAKKKK
ncbi:uncharacterized protein [Fopius arisanus]|uniref:Uncharacterized protein n=1 Tax=Fopius arisanus TaxID=64838 RepID=A0A9R1TEV2_9HYME|nr:PREDICTED: uncharacterized protein LOC105270071 [Fopius arisanus]